MAQDFPAHTRSRVSTARSAYVCMCFFATVLINMAGKVCHMISACSYVGSVPNCGFLRGCQISIGTRPTLSLSNTVYMLHVRLQLTSASRKLFMQVSGIASAPSRASILCHVSDGLRKRELEVYLKIQSTREPQLSCKENGRHPKF